MDAFDTFIDDYFDTIMKVFVRTGIVFGVLLLVMVVDAVIFYYTGFSFLGELLARPRLLSRRG